MAPTSSKHETRHYPFRRSYRGSMRLNFNHFWMKALTGYLIHPKIPVSGENLRVADVGTGTGIWASEVAGSLPSSAKIDAIDISSDQFPPEGWRVTNVEFRIHDCFEPFSPEYLGSFDFVNFRFWLCIVNDNVAQKLLQNLLTLLKPGGYIQWFEALPRSARVVARNGGKPTPALDRMAEQWKKPAAHSSYDWVHGLADLFLANGMQVEANEQFRNPGHYQTIASQSHLAGLEEYLDQNPEAAKYQEQLEEECAEGSFVDVSYTLVVGRKL